jgi:hypothetical protein
VVTKGQYGRDTNLKFRLPAPCTVLTVPLLQRSRCILTGGQMTATNKIRIATTDIAEAAGIACSEISAALGLSVWAEFQEIEGACLILELRLGDAALPNSRPSHLAAAVTNAVPNVVVLRAWKQAACLAPIPRYSQNVLAECFDAIPPVAERAFIDNLPTAQWDHSDSKWHLAVPSFCTSQRIVGLSQRSGHTQRFSSLDVAAIQRGLAA